MADTRTPQLRRRFLVAAASLAVLLAIGTGVVARQSVRRIVARLAAERGLGIARQSATLIEQYTLEQRRLTEVLAATPTVVRAAEQAGDPAVRRFLSDAARRAGLSGIVLTERGGAVVATTMPTPGDLAGEEWWQAAMRDGRADGAARFDSATGTVTTARASAIRGTGGRAVGVLATVSPLAALHTLLPTPGDGASLQVVDSLGRLVITPDAARLLEPVPAAAALPRAAAPVTTVIPGVSGGELVASVPVASEGWWVVFRQPTAVSDTAAATALRTIYAGLAVLLAVAALLVWQLLGWVDRRVTQPVRSAAAVAARVADGDLSVAVHTTQEGAAEVIGLTTALHAMVGALRRLVGTIQATADEAAAMAAEISASTEQMSASTEEMASTCQDLSKRSADQSHLVRAAADDAAKVLEIASILAQGADDSVRRNAALAGTAQEHRTHLDHSAQALARLADEVQRGFQEADALAQASEQIQKFVTQTKSIAMQTNMLALNAAIEAARAGQQGRGFAVVADEVRKLASVAAVAATETTETMGGVVSRVRANRDRLERLAAAGAAARSVAEAAVRGLTAVTTEAEANDAWNREIARSATEVRALVEEITQRLNSLAHGTESLLASAEEIAASSQQQSASTQEIASSANQLAEAADRLTAAVASFRQGGTGNSDGA